MSDQLRDAMNKIEDLERLLDAPEEHGDWLNAVRVQVEALLDERKRLLEWATSTLAHPAPQTDYDKGTLTGYIAARSEVSKILGGEAMTTQDTLIQQLDPDTFNAVADAEAFVAHDYESGRDPASLAIDFGEAVVHVAAALRSSTQEASDLRERLERVREWADKVVRRFHDSHPTDMPHRPFKDCTHPVCFNASTIAAELGETGTDPEPSVVPVVVEDEYGEKNIEWGYPGETGETP